METVELILQERDGRFYLAAPEVGHFTCALPKGALCGAGARAGVLRSLGRADFERFVQAGVVERIESGERLVSATPFAIQRWNESANAFLASVVRV